MVEIVEIKIVRHDDNYYSKKDKVADIAMIMKYNKKPFSEIFYEILKTLPEVKSGRYTVQLFYDDDKDIVTRKFYVRVRDDIILIDNLF